MAKTEVYSWRLSPSRKAALEEAARRRETSLAQILDEVTARWLEEAGQLDAGEDERQRRLHAAAQEHVGTLRGGRSDRAESARRDLRVALSRRHRR
jgi:hypothetical protein